MCSDDIVSRSYTVIAFDKTRQDLRHPKLVCIAEVGIFFSTSTIDALFTSFGLSVVADVGVNVVVAMLCKMINVAQALPKQQHGFRNYILRLEILRERGDS